MDPHAQPWLPPNDAAGGRCCRWPSVPPGGSLGRRAEHHHSGAQASPRSGPRTCERSGASWCPWEPPYTVAARVHGPGAGHSPAGRGPPGRASSWLPAPPLGLCDLPGCPLGLGTSAQEGEVHFLTRAPVLECSTRQQGDGHCVLEVPGTTRAGWCGPLSTQSPPWSPTTLPGGPPRPLGLAAVRRPAAPVFGPAPQRPGCERWGQAPQACALGSPILSPGPAWRGDLRPPPATPAPTEHQGRLRPSGSAPARPGARPGSLDSCRPRGPECSSRIPASAWLSPKQPRKLCLSHK